MKKLSCFRTIKFRRNAFWRMAPEVRRLKAEYDTLQKGLIKNKDFCFDWQEKTPVKAGYIGLFAPMRVTYLNEIFVGLGVGAGHRLIDLGSGDGRVVFLATLFGAKAVGIEGDKELCNISLRMKEHLLSMPEFKFLRGAEMRRADFFNQDLSPFDIAFLYYPEPKEDAQDFCKRLTSKLEKELKPESLFVIYFYDSKDALVFKKA